MLLKPKSSVWPNGYRKQNITLIKGEIDTEKSYRVEFEKDQDTGLIYRAVINEK